MYNTFYILKISHIIVLWLCILRKISYIFLEILKGCEKKLLQTGDIIRKLRMENKYTQNELSIMLGLQLSTLQKYESGQIVNLKLETLRELCEIFEVPPIVFVFPNITEKDKRGLLRWYLKEYSDFNEKGAAKVIAYAEDLLKISDYKKST